MAHKCDSCRYKGEHQEMGFIPFGACTKETNLVRAEKNYNAECCPYIVALDANVTAEKLQAVCADLIGDKVQDDLEKAVEAIQRLAQDIAEVLKPIFNSVWEEVKKLYDAVLHVYPNKRVLHLALHHSKERVRKKNIHRIMRWIEKGGERCG